jgi:5-methylcytosine-specific restriction endonuclease McrA
MKLGLCECGCREPTTFYKGQRRRFVSGHNATGKPSRRKNGQHLKCTRCSAVFYAQKAQLQTRRYCSMTCRDGHRRERLGAANPSYRRIEVPCNVCEKPVQALPNALRRRPRQYCSYACGRIGQARAISGAREITDGKRLARIRDGHCCRFCDFRLALHVHHIIPRSKRGTNELGNLITLCPNHHAMVHRGMITASALRAAIA